MGCRPKFGGVLSVTRKTPPRNAVWKPILQETTRFAPSLAKATQSYQSRFAIQTQKLHIYGPERQGQKQIIPCHPVESKVTYEGKVWTVAEINLATGMHTLTRPPGITKSDLRMLDLEPFIDEDEEL